jgi:hypothetical protein
MVAKSVAYVIMRTYRNGRGTRRHRQALRLIQLIPRAISWAGTEARLTGAGPRADASANAGYGPGGVPCLSTAKELSKSTPPNARPINHIRNQ